MSIDSSSPLVPVRTLFKAAEGEKGATKKIDLGFRFNHLLLKVKSPDSIPPSERHEFIALSIQSKDSYFDRETVLVKIRDLAKGMGVAPEILKESVDQNHFTQLLEAISESNELMNLYTHTGVLDKISDAPNEERQRIISQIYQKKVAAYVPKVHEFHHKILFVRTEPALKSEKPVQVEPSGKIWIKISDTEKADLNALVAITHLPPEMICAYAESNHMDVIMEVQKYIEALIWKDDLIDTLRHFNVDPRQFIVEQFKEKALELAQRKLLASESSPTAAYDKIVALHQSEAKYRKGFERDVISEKELPRPFADKISDQRIQELAEKSGPHELGGYRISEKQIREMINFFRRDGVVELLDRTLAAAKEADPQRNYVVIKKHPNGPPFTIEYHGRDKILVRYHKAFDVADDEKEESKVGKLLNLVDGKIYVKTKIQTNQSSVKEPLEQAQYPDWLARQEKMSQIDKRVQPVVSKSVMRRLKKDRSGENVVKTQVAFYTEFQTDGDLQSYTRKSNPLPNQRINMMRDITHAVSLLHRDGLVHKDLKPENIFINNEGKILLADFESSKTFNELQEESKRFGWPGMTPGFIAPEVYRGQPRGKEIDIYALGMLFYELWTGNETPFRHITLGHPDFNKGLRDPEFLFGYPPEPGTIEDLIVRMTSEDPTKRPTLEDVQKQLASRKFSYIK